MSSHTVRGGVEAVLGRDTHGGSDLEVCVGGFTQIDIREASQDDAYFVRDGYTRVSLSRSVGVRGDSTHYQRPWKITVPLNQVPTFV